MVFQDPMTSLNPVMRIGKQIDETLRVRLGMNRQDAKARAIELLELVGIPSPEVALRAYPGQLSGGMRQRVVIAIALACSPKLLMADEPTTGLDVTIQAQILNLLDELKESLHMSVILVTHDLGVVATRTSRIVVMYAGRSSRPARPATSSTTTACPTPGRCSRARPRSPTRATPDW
jgi:ABC-type dipeptide/oligopeptide/nickel transport system ATPase component